MSVRLLLVTPFRTAAEAARQHAIHLAHCAANIRPLCVHVQSMCRTECLNPQVTHNTSAAMGVGYTLPCEGRAVCTVCLSLSCLPVNSLIMIVQVLQPGWQQFTRGHTAPSVTAAGLMCGVTVCLPSQHALRLMECMCTSKCCKGTAALNGNPQLQTTAMPLYSA